MIDSKLFKIVRQELNEEDEAFEVRIQMHYLLNGWEIVSVATDSWKNAQTTAIVYLRK